MNDLKEKIEYLEFKLNEIESRMLTWEKLAGILLGIVLGVFIMNKIFKFFN